VIKKSTKSYYRDDLFLQKLGNNIRKLRLERKMSQTDLAFKCNDIDYSQINRIELGKVNFSVSFLSLLSKALEVDTKDLFP